MFVVCQGTVWCGSRDTGIQGRVLASSLLLPVLWRKVDEMFKMNVTFAFACYNDA